MSDIDKTVERVNNELDLVEDPKQEPNMVSDIKAIIAELQAVREGRKICRDDAQDLKAELTKANDRIAVMEKQTKVLERMLSDSDEQVQTGADQ